MAPLLRPQWLRGRADDPFSPPFPVFADRGIKDAARLDAVYQRSRYPAHASWEGPDFLQSEALSSQSRFHVRTNAMGYRDVERSCPKPAGTTRIIVLGDYMVFGQGVEAGDAFPARLEQRLRERTGGRSVEVWNAGRQAGTAIEGLAALDRQLWECRPDALVLAYGFVDRSAVEDDFMPSAFLFPFPNSSSRWPNLLRPLLALASGPLSRSLLFNRLLGAVLGPATRRNVDRFGATMALILRQAAERGVAVALVDRQQLAPPPEVYRKLAASRPRVVYVSMSELYARSPPSPRQIREFDSGPHWTQVFPYAPPSGFDVSYYVDPFHPNRWGHELLAEGLARALLPLLPPRAPRSKDDVNDRQDGRAARQQDHHAHQDQKDP